MTLSLLAAPVSTQTTIPTSRQRFRLFFDSGIQEVDFNHQDNGNIFDYYSAISNTVSVPVPSLFYHVKVINIVLVQQTTILIHISVFQHSNNVLLAPNMDHTSPEWCQMDIERNTQINKDHDMFDSNPAFDLNNVPSDFGNDDPSSPINFHM
ncbi:hypothetical protein M422DRAFT_50204 [Sphaerobolus stellatus SS14]|uniref:Uncharacterized protein n=1 Tax=Sphaerobolus stellatus (strain SS14) TaxID=990650 RepID=A0A0C9V8L9_SPHS4|nr:hypothetical protein M422DRAFT_50204 [Sphaerobolus stellatus SS14]